MASFSSRRIAVAFAAVGLFLGLAWVLRARFEGPAAVGLPSQAASASASASAAHPLSEGQLERTVSQMRERVKADPKDAAAWAMLAHSYDMLGRYVDASATYARLTELLPNDAQVLVDAADSLALARGRQLQGEPLKLIQRALSLDPNNLKALSLAGTEAFDRKDAAQALSYWRRARELVKDPALTAEIDASIAAAIAMQSQPVAAAAAVSASAAASNAGGFVAGRLTLSAKLKDRVAAGDVLFVFARPADGSRMPVALMRRHADELPFDFRLDDSMAMVPPSRLSTQSRVVIGARISKRGDATPHAGDLQGFSAPVAPGATGVRVEISEVLP